MGADWVDYENHPTALALKGLTAARATALSHRGLADLEKIYLYADGCIPTDGAEHWAAYAKRLKLLASLKVEVEEP